MPEAHALDAKSREVALLVFRGGLAVLWQPHPKHPSRPPHEPPLTLCAPVLATAADLSGNNHSLNGGNSTEIGWVSSMVARRGPSSCAFGGLWSSLEKVLVFCQSLSQIVALLGHGWRQLLHFHTSPSSC